MLKRFVLWAAMATCVLAQGWQEDFSADPAASGWRIFGDTERFTWTNGAVRVAWDSDLPNSYFYKPLGSVVHHTDDFSFAFDLTIEELTVDYTFGYAFEIAVGLLNEASATAPTFSRGTGSHSPNLVEWDYFPDTGFRATVATAITSSNSNFAAALTFPLEMPQDTYRIALHYTATNRTLQTTMTRSGASFGPVKSLTLPETFVGFSADIFSINNYFDASENGRLHGVGYIDNVAFQSGTEPSLRISGRFVDAVWEVAFVSSERKSYRLERTVDFSEWTPLGESIPGTDGEVILEDTTPPSRGAFYRVRIIE